MPKEGISTIYITAKDGASQVLSLIGDKTKALDKETQQLAQHTAAMQKETKGLYTSQSKLKTELDAANNFHPGLKTSNPTQVLPIQKIIISKNFFSFRVCGF